MRRYSSLETPLLRVSRPVAACSRCRAAKIKCDGKLPACSACEKTGRESECSSSNDQFARGKERSYVASLESRIERLEKRISYAKMRKASITMREGDESPPEPPSLPTDRKDSLQAIRTAIYGKAARKREATDVNELVSDFGFLSVNATTRDFEASTTKMTFARLILAIAMDEPMSVVKSTTMPPKQDAMRLIQYYLDNFFVLLPVIQETALITALEAVYQQQGRPAEDFEHWILYMALALGSIGQSRTLYDQPYKDGVAWVARALKYADTVLATGHVTQIQALILLVQYSMLDPTHFDSWHLIGFACRAVVDLGYHQDPPKGQQPDKHTLDMRRRIFYCAYALDRSVSMVNVKCFSFTDDATSIDLPSMQQSLSSSSHIAGNTLTGPHSLEPALLLFQLRKAQSNWYQELFQTSRDPLQQNSTYIWKMCHDMRVWNESLPKTLPIPIREFFDLELLYSYIYCLAPSCRVPSVSDLGKTLIFEYAIAYMDKISQVCRNFSNNPFYSYHDALRASFIGYQFFAVLQGNKDQLLNGVVPFVHMTVSGPPPPPIPNIGRTDNVERSMRCMDQIVDVLRTYSERWDNAKVLQASVQYQATELKNELAGWRQTLRTKSVPAVMARAHTGPHPSGIKYENIKFENTIAEDWPGPAMGFVPAFQGQQQGEQQGQQGHPGLTRTHQSY